MNIHICCIGRLKGGPLKELETTYLKRLSWSVKIHELTLPLPNKEKEGELLLKSAPLKSFKIALDETGKNLKSPAFADFIQREQLKGESTFAFFIGGSAGLDESLKKQCNQTLSLGSMTWPHQWVRPMIIEQLYRAQQILAGHPYHKE